MVSPRLRAAFAYGAIVFLAFTLAEALGIALALGVYQALERPHQLFVINPLILVAMGAALAGLLFGLAFTWLLRRGRGIAPRYSYAAILFCVLGAEWTALAQLLPVTLPSLDRPAIPAFTTTLWWATLSGLVYRGGIALTFWLAVRRVVATPLPRWATIGCFAVGLLMAPLSWGLAFITESQIAEWPLPALAVAIMTGIVWFALPPAPVAAVAR